MKSFTNNLPENMISNDSNILPLKIVVSSQHSVYNMYKMFNGTNVDSNDFWSASSISYPITIKIDFGKNRAIGKYSFTLRNETGLSNAPKSWVLEASNTGNFNGEELVVDQRTITDWIAKETRDFTVSQPAKFQYYRIKFTAGGTATVGLTSLRMMEAVQNKVLIFNENKYKKYIQQGWRVVTSNTPTEGDFLGGNTIEDISLIPESAWAELFGDVELSCYTDDLTTSEVQFKIETEQFTLTDEWEDKMIKVIEYTDSPTQVESTITLKTEPFTLYDEFGESVDILYYTDDPLKTKADLELIANYTPLDEIDGDFDVVTWTNDEEKDTLDIVMSAPPLPQVIIHPTPFVLYGEFVNFLVEKSEPGGTVKFALSFDDDQTWYSFRYNKWNPIDLSDADGKSFMTVDDIKKIKKHNINKKGNSFKVAYFIDENIHYQDTLQLDSLGVKVKAPLEDVKFENLAFYLLNTTATINLTFAGNKLSGVLDDEDRGKVQYRVFLNDKPYFPSDGGFTSLAPSPLQLRLNISERDLVFGQPNKLKVEFQDIWGQTDYWEASVVGTYSGLMFMDENHQYYSNSFGEILKHLDFGIIIAGQTTIEKKVMVKNQLGEKVQNLLLEVQKPGIPEGVDIELSYASSPFIKEDFLLFNEFIDPDEEKEFYIRIATTINAPPAPNGQFEVRAKADAI